MTKEDMARKVRSYPSEHLLGMFVWMGEHFNPIDDEFCDYYNAVRDEILRRMNERD